MIAATSACSENYNGFGLENALVPRSQIFNGGPGRDGIPAIDKPVYTRAGNAGFLASDDRVLGIEIDGIEKAYPVRILNWHEIVNDSSGDTAFTITYCPLCGTGVAFSSMVNGRKLGFGVSGLLYNSDVLLYDRETESLWSQILGKAVTGEYSGQQLQTLPLQHTTWSNWKRYHPKTLVLSTATGYSRDYSKDPYEDYRKSRYLYFPVYNRAPEKFHPKENVLGLTAGNTHKAYPFVELNRQGEDRFTDTVDGRKYIIHWNSETQSGYITDDEGIIVPALQGYWFAWYAFHPETEVFTAPERP